MDKELKVYAILADDVEEYSNIKEVIDEFKLLENGCYVVNTKNEFRQLLRDELVCECSLTKQTIRTSLEWNSPVFIATNMGEIDEFCELRDKPQLVRVVESFIRDKQLEPVSLFTEYEDMMYDLTEGGYARHQMRDSFSYFAGKGGRSYDLSFIAGCEGETLYEIPIIQSDGTAKIIYYSVSNDLCDELTNIYENLEKSTDCLRSWIEKNAVDLATEEGQAAFKLRWL